MATAFSESDGASSRRPSLTFITERFDMAKAVSSLSSPCVRFSMSRICSNSDAACSKRLKPVVDGEAVPPVDRDGGFGAVSAPGSMQHVGEQRLGFRVPVHGRKDLGQHRDRVERLRVGIAE
jgi:hypothetical protein